jgi:hypothetical protein
MDILDKDKLRLLIKDWGAREVLLEFIEALGEHADQCSDMGLKEQAQDATELSELLSGVATVLST